jgi:hypothetical protein
MAYPMLASFAGVPLHVEVDAMRILLHLQAVKVHYLIAGLLASTVTWTAVAIDSTISVCHVR